MKDNEDNCFTSLKKKNSKKKTFSTTSILVYMVYMYL